jgi:membrane protease YdiL (CAAX protease family)
MTTADWCYTALITAVLLVDHFVCWPTFQRRARRDTPTARRWLWQVWMILLWGMVGVGTMLWVSLDRAWSTLGLTVSTGWRLWASVLLIAAFVLWQLRIITKIARVKGPKPKLRAQLGELSIVLPHTPAELRWFVALSLTAGVCEEFVFRGYLLWAFAPMLGWWGAAAASLAVFTAAHAYQGKEGAAKSGIAGTLLTLLVAFSGSLVPAIVLHAVADIFSGTVAWLILRDESAAATAGASPD